MSLTRSQAMASTFLLFLPIQRRNGPSEVAVEITGAAFLSLHPFCDVQRCTTRNIATLKTWELIIDESIDIAFITESWLLQNGDDAVIADLTPPTHKTVSFPRIGRRGCGICIIFAKHLEPSLSHKKLAVTSYEAAETRLVFYDTSITFICIYRPPPSKVNKLTEKDFFTEFPDLLSSYSDRPGDLVLLGDFNVHFEVTSNTGAKHLRNLFNDHNLTQVVCEPTHKLGHTLDLLVVRENYPCLQSFLVKDLALSDHKAIFFHLLIQKPHHSKRLITTRNLKKINLSVFQDDMATVASSLFTDCPDSCLVQNFNQSLRQTLDCHAPLCTRRVTDRPSSPWITDDIKDAKRQLQKTEKHWRSTHLTVHRQIFTHQRSVLKSLHRSEKRQYYRARLSDCTSTRTLFQVADELLGVSKDPSLPSSIPSSDLPDKFCKFFDKKISDIRSELDSSDST
ncbi:hypothetical protein BaRGS_00039772, partial [Batillaria attramentaria]